MNPLSAIDVNNAEPQQTIVDRGLTNSKNLRRPLGYPRKLKPTTVQYHSYQGCSLWNFLPDNKIIQDKHSTNILFVRHHIEPHDFHSLSLHEYLSKGFFDEHPLLNLASKSGIVYHWQYGFCGYLTMGYYQMRKRVQTMWALLGNFELPSNTSLPGFQ